MNGHRPGASLVSAKEMSETELRRAVMKLAKEHGWLRSNIGWTYSSRKVIKGDPGLPDLLLVRNGMVLFAELKREGEKPEADQKHWIEQLEPGCRVYLWYPSDLLSGRIGQVLQ